MRKLLTLCIASFLMAASPGHATVSVEISRVQYNCNGTTVSYAYPFKVFEDTDLVVVKTTGNLDTALAINTDYTVTGVGTTTGGHVVLTSGSRCSNGSSTICMGVFSSKSSTSCGR